MIYEGVFRVSRFRGSEGGKKTGEKVKVRDLRFPRSPRRFTNCRGARYRGPKQAQANLLTKEVQRDESVPSRGPESPRSD